MAEPPFPPPGPRRPFDWQRDAPEWGEEGWDPDKTGCLFLALALICLMAGAGILYVTLLR